MEVAQDAISRSRNHDDVSAATPLWRYLVIVGDHVDGGSALRTEDPARLLRVYSLLQATTEQLRGTTLPQAGMPGLQRQLGVIRREAERAASLAQLAAFPAGWRRGMQLLGAYPGQCCQLRREGPRRWPGSRRRPRSWR
jgi:hypothetical protein